MSCSSGRNGSKFNKATKRDRKVGMKERENNGGNGLQKLVNGVDL